MADYYPLISRAVSGLDKNTGENRRALYDRARVALVNQLRGVQPALEESDITRERLALEEAIRKVEAETAKRVRAETPEPEEPSLRDRGLRDFRETVAEAEGLGSASAEAKRAAHATYEAMPVRNPRGSRGDQGRPDRDDIAPAGDAHVFSRLQCRPCRALRQVFGAGGAALRAPHRQSVSACFPCAD